jgi:hypothetical protein
MGLEEIEGLLITGLCGEPAVDRVARFAELAATDWSALLTLATHLGLDSLLYHGLMANGIDAVLPPSILAQLQAGYYRQAAHNLRLYGELGALIDALHQEEIPVLVLKGAHLAAAVYPDIGLRKMIDIDLMVPEAQLLAAFTLVQGLGYFPLEPLPSTPPLADVHHLPRLFKADAVAGVEIHWTIAHPGKPYGIGNVGALWARAQPVCLAGVDALGLAPEDLLLHLCLHATHHHRLMQGLRPLCDVDRVVRRYEGTLDWQRVAERARSQHWSKGVHLMLYLARTWLNTPVPESVVQALQSPGFTPQMGESALRYMLLDRPPEGEISREFSHMWHQPGLGVKLRRMVSRWLLPRAIMAEMYPVSADSPRLYVYYLVRLKDLLVRYHQPLRRLIGGDPQMQLLTHQQSLRQWLGE